MRFKLSDTNALLSEERPCPEAVFLDGGWWIDIDSLEELVQFSSRQEGRLVRIAGDVPTIEICDDYRE